MNEQDCPSDNPIDELGSDIIGEDVGGILDGPSHCDINRRKDADAHREHRRCDPREAGENL